MFRNHLFPEVVKNITTDKLGFGDTQRLTILTSFNCLVHTNGHARVACVIEKQNRTQRRNNNNGNFNTSIPIYIVLKM